jgi:hypothetical protein
MTVNTLECTSSTPQSLQSAPAVTLPEFSWLMRRTRRSVDPSLRTLYVVPPFGGAITLQVLVEAVMTRPAEGQLLRVRMRITSP